MLKVYPLCFVTVKYVYLYLVFTLEVIVEGVKEN